MACPPSMPMSTAILPSRSARRTSLTLRASISVSRWRSICRWVASMRSSARRATLPPSGEGACGAGAPTWIEKNLPVTPAALSLASSAAVGSRPGLTGSNEPPGSSEGTPLWPSTRSALACSRAARCSGVSGPAGLSMTSGAASAHGVTSSAPGAKGSGASAGAGGGTHAASAAAPRSTRDNGVRMIGSYHGGSVGRGSERRPDRAPA